MKPLLFLTFLFACSNPTTVNIPKEITKETKSQDFPPNEYLIDTGGCLFKDSLKVDSVGENLFKDNKSNLYFKTYDLAKHKIPVLILRLYNACEGDSTYDLANYIDINSFHKLNGIGLYKDNKHVYIHNEMIDGGNIGLIENADLKTFRAIPHSFYAIDKKYVYYQGMIIKNADCKTFEGVFKIVGNDTVCWFGKDRKNYFDGTDLCTKDKVEEYLKQN
ncbi:MAG: DKNYY domain-containing protein [Bacteroidia bacterium]